MKIQQIGMIKIIFKKILAIADSKKFSHKNKISNFKCNDVNNLINNIRNNTIREILAKKI